MAKLRSDRYKLNVVADELQKAKLLEDDKVTYRDIFIEDFLTLLQTSIEISEDVPEPEQRRIIIEALFSSETGKITGKSILAQVSRREQAFLRTVPRRYILATSLSTRPVVRRLSVPSVSIRFSASLPAYVDRKPLEDDFRRNNHNPNPGGYSAAVISVAGRSKHEAFEKGLEALDYLRGLWNFSLNRRTGWRLQSGPSRQPVNDIRLGQVHTLHDENGRPIDDSYWFEPFFVPVRMPRSERLGWSTIRREERQIRVAMKRCNYADDLKTAFVRYTRALDTSDYESCYLKLWSLLEFLTGTADGRNEDLIRRCVFLYEDRELARQVLEHLRDRRNAHVHAGRESYQLESLVFQLKRLVERFLLFHVVNGRQFRSIADAGSYLDLPVDPDTLRQRIARFKMALRFRKGGGPTQRGPTNTTL